MSPLDSLIIENTDADQLWEQLQLLNTPLLDFISKEIKRVEQVYLLKQSEKNDDDSNSDSDEEQTIVHSGSLSTNDLDSEVYTDSDSDLDDEMEDLESGSVNDSDARLEEEMNADSDSQSDEVLNAEMEEMNADSDRDIDELKSKKRQRERTIVDDKFFSLREMENFAEMAEEFDLMNGGELGDNNGVQMTESRKRKVMSAFGGESDDSNDEEDGGSNRDLGNSSQDEDSDEDENDLIGENESDDNANEIRYEDFFGEKEQVSSAKTGRVLKKRNKNHEAEEMDDYYSDNESKRLPQAITAIPVVLKIVDTNEQVQSVVQSTFEKKQSQMDTIIQQLESEAIKDKHWVLKGEASSKNRPLNSLLEEDLEVDYNKRPAPIITEENTQTIEDMIKQRILDDLFDDVERKIPPKERNFDPNRKIQMNDEKSTKSLAQVYEDEFLKQKQGDSHKTEKDTALEKTHKEIQTLFNSICSNLDALSNWHFTPKALAIDLQVLPSVAVPAISMEDTLPSAVNTNASTLAPKEIYDGKVQKSQAEKDSDDKRRERSAKKSAFKKRKIEEKLVDKLREQQVETNPNAQKEKAVKELMKDKNVTFIDDKKAPRLKDGKPGAKSMRQGERIGAEKKDSRKSQNFKL